MENQKSIFYKRVKTLRKMGFSRHPIGARQMSYDVELLLLFVVITFCEVNVFILEQRDAI